MSGELQSLLVRSGERGGGREQGKGDKRNGGLGGTIYELKEPREVRTEWEGTEMD